MSGARVKTPFETRDRNLCVEYPIETVAARPDWMQELDTSQEEVDKYFPNLKPNERYKSEFVDNFQGCTWPSHVAQCYNLEGAILRQDPLSAANMITGLRILAASGSTGLIGTFENIVTMRGSEHLAGYVPRLSKEGQQLYSKRTVQMWLFRFDLGPFGH